MQIRVQHFIAGFISFYTFFISKRDRMLEGFFALSKLSEGGDAEASLTEAKKSQSKKTPTDVVV